MPAGFIVFVGVVLPLVMVSLWMFWECCYEVEEDDSEECRQEIIGNYQTITRLLDITSPPSHVGMNLALPSLLRGH